MSPAPCLKGLRVLIVDDCRDAANSLKFLLSHWGHDAQVVHDGLAALEAASATQPDLVLLDIGLPGIDGWEVAIRLRQLPGLEKCVVMAVSGYTTESDAQHSHAVGCNCHLAKPVDPDELRRMLT